MQITTTARHFELTPALKDHIEERLSKLTKYFDQLIRSHVTLSVQKHEHMAEISLHGSNVDLNGRGKSEDMYVSVDLAVDKLERQLRKFKEKIRIHKGRTSLSEELSDQSEE
ncbi:MAG: ribosome-associated translation inhibitor RaiA, partial [Candidatus Eisenbacteria sp.]|nr:ribosome-associated translation inhibitor RaiA [Candidatus Eisenbacteria bacterium]